MTKHRKANVALFIVVAGIWIYLLGYGYEADREDAAAIDSREVAAQKHCGQNSVVRWENDAPQCLTKHGKPVKVATK